ncbi:helix-hairpin-helix domain-containing protein, partial [Escherichia coli]|nr:helix-hairpin-helix domain-containing protein [Escherichia coli]
KEAKKFRRKPEFSNHSSMIKNLSKVTDWYSFMSEEKMKGIRMDLVRIFVENRIRTSSDFKKWTEKEVLALKGIGPVTVKKLKENGIKFKNEK